MAKKEKPAIVQVRLLVPMGTVEKSYMKGDLFKCSADEAKRLIADDKAEAVKGK